MKSKRPGKTTQKAPASTSDSGNFISEWFGRRIYPVVRIEHGFGAPASYPRCPFLSEVLEATVNCVKTENSLGVCTINAESNGKRQDWLACPYRVISSNLVSEACGRIFGASVPFAPAPASVLLRPESLTEFKDQVGRFGHGYLFFQDKLGGEISVPGTDRSPEVAFDVTLGEVVLDGNQFVLKRFGILEIQTMDFHGSYKDAVTNLRDGLRLHLDEFPQALAKRLDWAPKNIEGPNIANVFKRTFYQVLMKFELGGSGSAAGTVLAIPQSVWDSWQPFLG